MTQSINEIASIASFDAQVGFGVPAEPPSIFFSEGDLTPEVVTKYGSLECHVIAETEEDYQRVTETLSRYGLRAESILWWTPDTSLPLVREAVRVNARPDENVFRAVGKIALNYLAYVLGAEFCLTSEFDRFRRFVRYGEGDWRSFIAISQDLLLFDERRSGKRQTRGHILIAEWKAGAGAPTASGKLFNDVLYRVHFAERVSAVWRDVRSGHHFNLKTLKIDPIKIVDHIVAAS